MAVNVEKSGSGMTKCQLLLEDDIGSLDDRRPSCPVAGDEFGHLLRRSADWTSTQLGQFLTRALSREEYVDYRIELDHDLGRRAGGSKQSIPRSGDDVGDAAFTDRGNLRQEIKPRVRGYAQRRDGLDLRGRRMGSRRRFDHRERRR